MEEKILLSQLSKKKSNDKRIYTTPTSITIMRIWIESNYGILKFEYVITTTNHNFIDKQLNDFSGFKTYEETELECLKKLIEIVNDK